MSAVRPAAVPDADPVVFAALPGGGAAVLVVVPVVPVPGPEFVRAVPAPVLAAVLFASEVIIHSTALKGTATSFSPIPKKPPTPITTASALPFRSMRTSLTSPIRSLFAPYTVTPTSFEARQWLADCWVTNLPEAADDAFWGAGAVFVCARAGNRHKGRGRQARSHVLA